MKSAIEAAGPEVGGYVPFDKKMEILKKYGECRDAGIEYPGDIHFDLYGEPGPDKGGAEEKVSDEILKEVESYHFTWVENDEAGDIADTEEYEVTEEELLEASKRFRWNEIGGIKILGDIVSPLYREAGE